MRAGSPWAPSGEHLSNLELLRLISELAIMVKRLTGF